MSISKFFQYYFFFKPHLELGMEKSPEPSREGHRQETHEVSSNLLPISRENEIWIAIIVCILIVGFIALFLII